MPTRRAAVADVYAHLKSVMMSLGRQMEAELTKTGMSMAQLMLLWRLTETDGALTPKQLSKILGVTPGNVTRLVEKLEAMGYVTRTRSTTDLRVVHVKATRAGSGIFQGGFDVQAKILTRAFGDWSDEEVAQFRAMLTRLDPDVPAAGDVAAPQRVPSGRPAPRTSRTPSPVQRNRRDGGN